MGVWDDYLMFWHWRHTPAPSAPPVHVDREPDETLLLESIDRETDRQLNAHSHTVDAIVTRAALIVTTAVVFVSLIYESKAGSCATFLSLCTVHWVIHYTSLVLSVGAAVLGVRALFMNREGEETDLDEMEEALVGKADVVVLRSIVQSKVQTLNQDRETMKGREQCTRRGFILLVVALIATVVSAIVKDWM